jgi:hypothetical protein
MNEYRQHRPDDGGGDATQDKPDEEHGQQSGVAGGGTLWDRYRCGRGHVQNILKERTAVGNFDLKAALLHRAVDFVYALRVNSRAA